MSLLEQVKEHKHGSRNKFLGKQHNGEGPTTAGREAHL